MAKFFIISAVSRTRHLELVNEKSDIYDSAEAYCLNYQEKMLEGNGSVDSPFKIEVSIQNKSDKAFEGIIHLELEAKGPADFYLPGFMYGSNRGDKPWKVDCKYPRLNSPLRFDVHKWQSAKNPGFPHISLLLRKRFCAVRRLYL